MNSTQNPNPLYLNTKNKNKISKTSITFIDSEVYIKNNKLYTKYAEKNISSGIPQHQL